LANYQHVLRYILPDRNKGKKLSLSATYNGEMTSKTAKIMNGDITLAAPCQYQRASKIISPYIISAVFDVSFRRYKL